MHMRHIVEAGASSGQTLRTSSLSFSASFRATAFAFARGVAAGEGEGC
eukprot:SAG31_NODE_4707_length_3019_cov_1.720205_3_plen_48_part_00